MMVRFVTTGFMALAVGAVAADAAEPGKASVSASPTGSFAASATPLPPPVEPTRPTGPAYGYHPTKWRSFPGIADTKPAAVIPAAMPSAPPSNPPLLRNATAAPPLRLPVEKPSAARQPELTGPALPTLPPAAKPRETTFAEPLMLPVPGAKRPMPPAPEPPPVVLSGGSNRVPVKDLATLGRPATPPAELPKQLGDEPIRPDWPVIRSGPSK